MAECGKIWKLLKKLGFELKKKRGKGRHQIWKRSNCTIVLACDIPSREIPTGTFKTVLKDIAECLKYSIKVIEELYRKL